MLRIDFMHNGRNIFFLALLIFSSCAPPPVILNHHGNFSLKRQIDGLINTSGTNANMSIKINSLNSGKTLYSLNSEKLHMPASNNKLYTCAAALVLLGVDYQFNTSVFRNGNNLILKGGGDPDFSLHALDSLAEQISQKILFVDTLFVDESLMDTLHYGEGWMWDEGAECYAAPVSAVTLNDNCVDFYVQPGNIGEKVAVNTNPQTDYIQIENQSLIVNDINYSKKFKIERDWAGRTNRFFISGEKMVDDGPDTLYRNIVDPPLFAGTIFREMLEKYGINVNYMQKGRTAVNDNPIANHTSDSLIVFARNLMSASDNLTAELFVKTMGISEETPGNWNDGIIKIKSFLADSVKIDTSAIRIADGSGVSRYNLTNADQIIDLLIYMYYSPYQKEFLDVLPSGGISGTLKNRMKNYGYRIKAKTGGLSGVSCLSGYAFSPQYGPLVFSMLMNGYVGSSTKYRKLQDDILELLVHD